MENRNQSYQQDWNDNDQRYDRYRENQNRYQRYKDRRGYDSRNRDWQNGGDRSGYGDQFMNTNRDYENRGVHFDDRNRRGYDRGYDQYREQDYRGSNQGYENRNYNQNYAPGNYGTGYRNSRNTDDRDWWDRTSDEVASWFGDEDAERRRRMDKINGPHKGKGPKGYTRSDQRIIEDINEKLYQDPFVDASNIEVTVAEGEVTLSGTIDSRDSKRRAEELAEEVSGVKDVTNHLKISSTSTYEASNADSDQYNGRKKSSWLS